MNYPLLMSSLERFALLKTAITLWNPDNICLTASNFYFSKKQWKITENCVIERGKELPLPESLKKKVLDFIRPIGSEIRDFLNTYIYFLSDGKKDRVISVMRKSIKRLCWLPEGIIDEKKTAAEFIRDENLSITTRYRLACIYCFEDYIFMLWNKMPEDCKKSFYNEKDPSLVNQDELVVFWTYDIKGEVTRLDNIFMHGSNPYTYAFNYAASRGNKAATEHFFQKLTSEEREECLENPIINRGTLFYFLSQMNEVQQVRLFRARSWFMLIDLLAWPLQGLFMEIAKHITFDNGTGYILKAFFEKINGGFKDYNYQKLFTEFWQLIPITVKKSHVLELCLSNLLDMKDTENFKIVLEDEAMYSEKFIFSDQGKNFCMKLIYDDEMDLLEFFVQKYILSKDQMITFREELERYIKCYFLRDFLREKKDLLKKAFKLLNDLTQNFDKRCVEEENNGPVKRICNLTNELNFQKKKSPNSSDHDTPKKTEEEKEDVLDELNFQKKKSPNSSDDDTPKKAEEEREDVPNELNSQKKKSSNSSDDDTPKKAEEEKEDVPVTLSSKRRLSFTDDNSKTDFSKNYIDTQSVVDCSQSSIQKRPKRTLSDLSDDNSYHTDVNSVAGPSWKISEPDVIAEQSWRIPEPVADSNPRVIERRKRRRESANTTEDQIILRQEKMLQTLTNIEENSRIQIQEIKELNKNITLLNDNFVKAVQLLANANNVPTNE